MNRAHFCTRFNLSSGYPADRHEIQFTVEPSYNRQRYSYQNIPRFDIYNQTYVHSKFDNRLLLIFLGYTVPNLLSTNPTALLDPHPLSASLFICVASILALPLVNINLTRRQSLPPWHIRLRHCHRQTRQLIQKINQPLKRGAQHNSPCCRLDVNLATRCRAANICGSKIPLGGSRYSEQLARSTP